MTPGRWQRRPPRTKPGERVWGYNPEALEAPELFDPQREELGFRWWSIPEPVPVPPPLPKRRKR